jgi:apolipoprotein N-acyltransferase
MEMRARIMSRIDALSRKGRLFLAFLAGIAAAPAMPPADAVPLLFLSLPLLLLLLRRAGGRGEAFALGWMWGFGFLLIGLYWVCFSMGSDIARYWWFIPIAATALPAGLAIFYGLAGLGFRLIPWRRGIGEALGLAALLSDMEWLRGHVLTGFPWHLAGTAWEGVPPLLQLCAATGIYGLSLLTLIAACLVACLAMREVPLRRAGAALGAAALVLGAVFVWGALRLAAHPAAMEPGVRLRLVQPNIPPIVKWDEAEQAANMENLIELSRAPGLEGITAVVWPETAIGGGALGAADTARILARWPEAAERAGLAPGNAYYEYRLAPMAAPKDGLLLAGELRWEEDGSGERFYNSLSIYTPDGHRPAVYDKHHLVPFGEVTPFRWLPPVAALAASVGDFTPGPGPRVIGAGRVPGFLPLICYEGIFPQDARPPEGPRPSFLLNATNDAWFGRTAGPHQHFALERLRAVEQGLPMVRVANTGISGMIDPLGRVTARLELGERGTLDLDLPARLEALTPYARFGDAVYAGLLMICALLGFPRRFAAGENHEAYLSNRA